MIKSSLPAVVLVALVTSFGSQALAASPHARGLVGRDFAASGGREIAAPSWSAACTTDNGPRVCDEPMWVYGSPADISRYKKAF
jgi:hypothetical protein